MIPALLVGFLFKRGSATTESTGNPFEQKKRLYGRDDHSEEAEKERAEAGRRKLQSARNQKMRRDEAG
jgi:hypothetical protein